MRFILVIFLLSFSLMYGQKKIDFKKADSTALAHKGQSLNNLPLLTHELTAHLSTDVEKFRAIYSWVCTNIENDYHSYIRTSKKRKKLNKDRQAFLEWNNSFTPKVFEQLVKERKTACTGYAYLIKEMANLAGFPCKIVNGYGRTPTLLLEPGSPPNHSWNIVKLNDTWYLCDATWSAGKIMLDEDGPRFEQDYNDAYFMADPTMFIKNHYPMEKEMSLLKETPSLSNFMEGPVIYKEAFSLGVSPLNPQKMQLELVRGERIAFDMTIPEGFEINKFNLALNNGSRDIPEKPSIKLLSPTKAQLEYVFEKTGLYDTHIKVGNDIVATYVVRVKRK